MSALTLGEVMREELHERGWYARADLKPGVLTAISLDLEAAVLAWVEERLTGAREDVAVRLAGACGGWHDSDDPNADNWNPEADAALDAIRQALGNGAGA